MHKRAIILAAGRGSRMGAATENSHKCMTILNNKPLLSWQINSIQKAGIQDITVVRGYKAELLTGDFQTVYNPRWAETNMVASLFCAPKFDGETIISYSDIVYKSSHISDLLSSKADIAIVADIKWKDLWELRFDNPLDDAETFKSDNGKLIEIGGKTNNIEDIQAQYMGLLKVNSTGWNKMFELYNSLSDTRKDKLDMTSLLAELLKINTTIEVVFVEGGWCEVDNYNDVLAYEKEIVRSNNWTHFWN